MEPNRAPIDKRSREKLERRPHQGTRTYVRGLFRHKNWPPSKSNKNEHYEFEKQKMSEEGREKEKEKITETEEGEREGMANTEVDTEAHTQASESTQHTIPTKEGDN